MAYTAMDLAWLEMILQDLNVNLDGIPLIFCDNVSALALSCNPVFHAKSKHIEVDFHFIRQRVKAKQVAVQYAPSAAQIADILTKGLPISRFNFLPSKLMVSNPINLRGGKEYKDKSSNYNNS